MKQLNTAETIEQFDLCITRNEVAEIYSDSLSIMPDGTPAAYADMDFTALNAYIMKRWSKSTVKYIKREAWKLTEKRLGRKVK